jgi:hypothetical protein
MFFFSLNGLSVVSSLFVEVCGKGEVDRTITVLFSGCCF